MCQMGALFLHLEKYMELKKPTTLESAQIEYMVLVTETGIEILTK